jgi:hypothetical protein
MPRSSRRGHTEIDAPVLDRHPDPAVLGDSLLRDVEVAHDLDPRDHARDHSPRHPSRLRQDAVDAEADPHLGLLGLEVDVGGTLRDGLAEDAVDELDHRPVVGRRTQIGGLDRRGLLLFLLVALGDRIGDRALHRRELADQRRQVLRGGDRDFAVEAGGHLHVVQRQHVGRVRHREQQGALPDVADRERLVPPRRLD